MAAIRIGIIGDFKPENATHLATNDGIQHAAEVLQKPIEAVWLPTDEPVKYEEFDGLIGSPGSPYRSSTELWREYVTHEKTRSRLSAPAEDPSI